MSTTSISGVLGAGALSRRRFLTLGGGAVAAAGFAVVTGTGLVGRAQPASAAGVTSPPVDPGQIKHLIGTDGWVYLPPLNQPYHPDLLAPAGLNTYVFGFRDVSNPAFCLNNDVTQGPDAARIAHLQGRAQISAPILGFDEKKGTKITLTNLGLKVRPDLGDGHTIHWHGFRNAIPLMDGVPEMSVATPIGRRMEFYYDTKDQAGTYMYHCHFEDVEHVQMGMSGLLYIRPQLNATLGGTFAYNDPTTRYDREFGILLTEFYAQSHWNDAHIQVSDWSDFKADLWMMNGRSYPDTTAPNGALDTATLDLAPQAGAAGSLQYQPITSLIQCNLGETFLLRLANLGYQEHSLTAPGLTLNIVGADAVQLRHAYDTSTIDIGPGESFDVLCTPQQQGTFLLYSRDHGQQGQRTEIRVGSGRPAQREINQ